jgi:NAD(P)-dependent dehydrogenase (short-subunit alcohol dehydrogenase family)
MRLKDKVSMITGAASGIGRAAALRMAEEGSDLFLIDIAKEGLNETAEEIDRKGRKCNSFICDVSDEKAMRGAVEEAIQNFGHIDILVNVAGIQITKSVTDTTYLDYKRMMDINVGGTFLTMNMVLPLMKDRGKGAIVNVASELAFVGYPELAVYTGTKGAMVSMTRSVALEAIKYGVRVNCVCPGATDTPIFWEGETNPVRIQQMLDQVKVEKPIGRLITTDEVASGIIFMASDEASGIVGTSLIIDGGFIAQ